MAKKQSQDTETGRDLRRKALSPDARENQLIALAMDTVEERMLNGTASSQEIVHFLRLGSSLARLQKEEIRERIELDKTKVKSIESAEEYKKLYSEAIEAMKSYGSSSM